MSQNNHTPGPWSASKAQEVSVKPKTHHMMIVGPQRENIGLISSWRTVAIEAMEAEANARLIAAAPELLEALELLIAESDPLRLNSGEPWCRVRAVIAKARGEA